MDDKMLISASRALKEILKVEEGTKVLVVTDTHTKVVGDAFFEGVKKLGGYPEIYFIEEAIRPIKEIPEALLKMIPDKEVGVTVFKGFPQETPFRISLIKTLMKTLKRLGHGPGITASMLTEGPMNIDYKELIKNAESLIKAFEGAVSVCITAPAGTDITLDIKERRFKTDVVINEGSWGNLPAGEIWCAPVEDAANGIIVCDGSIGDLGNVPSPLKICVKSGVVEKVECADNEFERKVKEYLDIDREASVIGELGIGLNPGARLVGNLLEDEKAFKTAHIAFGNNEDMPGGRNRSKTHRDFLFREPTFLVKYQDGSEKILIKNGIINF